MKDYSTVVKNHNRDNKEIGLYIQRGSDVTVKKEETLTLRSQKEWRGIPEEETQGSCRSGEDEMVAWFYAAR